MNSEESKEDWARLHKSLTDPEEHEKAKRLADRDKRREQNKIDTGV